MTRESGSHEILRQWDRIDGSRVPSSGEALGLHPGEIIEVLLPATSQETLGSTQVLRGHGEIRTVIVTSGTRPLVLELIGLEAPEPLERILETLAQTAPGQVFLAELPHRPLPLFRVLSAQGTTFQFVDRSDGSCLVAIRR